MHFKIQKNIIIIAGATIEGNDLSLFYGNQHELTTITSSRTFLPKDIYRTMVLDSVICCVDILAVRINPNNPMTKIRSKFISNLQEAWCLKF